MFENLVSVDVSIVIFAVTLAIGVCFGSSLVASTGHQK